MRERSAPTSSNIDNIPDFIETENDKNFCDRMASIFAESDSVEEQTSSTSKASENPSSSKLFSSTVFLKVSDNSSVRVGLALIKKEHTSLLLYDGSKNVIDCIDINDVIFNFNEHQLTTSFWKKEKDTTMDITFIDSAEFTTFTIHLLLNQNRSHMYTLCNSDTDQLELDCSVLYDMVRYTIEDGELSLPVSQPNIKCKLVSEKITNHPLHSYFIGLSKGAHILVRTDENTVVEIRIRKVKFVGEKREKTAEPEIVEKTDGVLIDKEPTKDKNNIEQSNIEYQKTNGEESACFSSEVAKGPESEEFSKHVEPFPSIDRTDLHEILHRVVGVEMDRIQMRIDAKLDVFRAEILQRLDHQNQLLEKLVNQKPSDKL